MLGVWQPAMNLKRYWKDNVPGDFGNWGSTLLEVSEDREYFFIILPHVKTDFLWRLGQRYVSIG